MSANSRQVAGKHYEGLIQHWDFVVANNLDYFQAQITRYITRCKKKNGKEDLEKAIHYLQKYEEVVTKDPLFLVGCPEVRMPTHVLAHSMSLDEDQHHFLGRVVHWDDIGVEELARLRIDLTSYMECLYPSGEAGPGYVNQDR